MDQYWGDMYYENLNEESVEEDDELEQLTIEELTEEDWKEITNQSLQWLKDEPDLYASNDLLKPDEDDIA